MCIFALFAGKIPSQPIFTGWITQMIPFENLSSVGSNSGSYSNSPSVISTAVIWDNSKLRTSGSACSGRASFLTWIPVTFM